MGQALAECIILNWQPPVGETSELLATAIAKRLDSVEEGVSFRNAIRSLMQRALSVTREADFPAWYQAVVDQADLAETSPVRPGVTGFGNSYRRRSTGAFAKRGTKTAIFLCSFR